MGDVSLIVPQQLEKGIFTSFIFKLLPSSIFYVMFDYLILLKIFVQIYKIICHILFFIDKINHNKIYSNFYF
jgi:hypothetical protein